MSVVRGQLVRGRVGFPSRVPLPGLRALVVALAIPVVIGTLLAIGDTAMWRTTYAGSAPEAALAELAAGLGLIGAGLYAGLDRGGRALSMVMVLAGVAWLSTDLVGWQRAATEVRILALAGALLAAPALLHITAMAPGHHPAARPLRVIVATGYVLAILLGGALVLLYDPAADVACWRLCSSNPYLVAAVTGLATVLHLAVACLAVLGGAAIATVAAWRMAATTPTRRRDLWPILVPAVLVGCAIAARGLAAAIRGIEGPLDQLAMLLFQLSAWTVAALAAGVALVIRRSRRTRAAIRALATLKADGQSLRSATEVLAAATGDPSLRVAYRRSPYPETYVDASGADIPTPIGGAGRSVTTVTRMGEVVALIEHDGDRIGPADLAEHLGPAARLALENERLDAELQAQLRDLRLSRVRIVVAGDRERMRRERDLHDGAQQRLLALSYDIRSALAAASQKSRDAIAEHLDAAIAEVQAAHDELREVAHGIYPAVLAEAGLARALETLVDRSPIPLRLVVDGTDRCAPGTEMTAWVVATELIGDAVGRGANRALLRVAAMTGQLVLEADDDGRMPEAPIVHGQDRAGAAGGRLVLEPADGDNVRQRMEIPCAPS